MATTKNYSDSDTRAPRSPWGPAQQVVTVQRGVRWFSTAGHGGLCVGVATALKTLSPAALGQGFVDRGYVWFEEDEACARALKEHPEWEKAILGCKG